MKIYTVIGFYVIKYFMETPYKLTTCPELVLKLRELYGRPFTDRVVFKHLNTLVEMGILKKEAKGYALSSKVLINCYQQYETRRREILLGDKN